MIKKQYLLMILDGVGINSNTEGNALKLANTPNLDSYFLKYKNTTLKCSGLDVGLPIGQMGNSEVGHMSIGSGRIVYQDLTRIDKDISDGTFFKNNFLIKAMVNTKINNSSLHIMGLLSDGGVHSHIEHLYAILKLAKEKNVKHVYIHAFL
ncbi:MAG: 2,3-bisphosphoglycerate-independent phosphoglycerate mutase, partial [Clostridia bacterium]